MQLHVASKAVKSGRVRRGRENASVSASYRLVFLTLLDLLKRLFDSTVRFVFKFRISNQPLIEGFFRPEEVDDPSTTARKEDR
jgi:hypothetical protein